MWRTCRDYRGPLTKQTCRRTHQFSRSCHDTPVKTRLSRHATHSVVAPTLTAPLMTGTHSSTVGSGTREDIVTMSDEHMMLGRPQSQWRRSQGHWTQTESNDLVSERGSETWTEAVVHKVLLKGVFRYLHDVCLPCLGTRLSHPLAVPKWHERRFCLVFLALPRSICPDADRGCRASCEATFSTVREFLSFHSSQIVQACCCSW